MGEQYGRTAIVNVDGKELTTKASTGVDDRTGSEDLGLRIAFKVEKTLKPAPNQAELRLWNLSEDSRKALVKDAVVSIEAGYGDDTSLIFLGDMKKIDHIRDGANWITHLRIGDGEKEIKKARVSTSFKPGTSPEQVMKKLTGALNIPAKSALDKARNGDLKGALKEFSAGFVAAGRAFDEIVKVGTMLGYDVSVQDGELLLLGPDETNGASSVDLAPDSGLIGSPEQAEDKTIKAQALLNGELSPGRSVELTSAQFQGSCRVEKVTMVGDTHGNEWFCNLELKRMS